MLGSIRGRLGDVVFRNVNGRTYASRRPQRPAAAPTDRQVEQQVRFRQASAYAKRVTADPREGVRYAPFLRNGSGYTVALRDYLRAPEITSIDLQFYVGGPDDLIRIDATDDTAVAAVTVTLRDREGAELERGPAERFDDLRWFYRPQRPAHHRCVATVEVAADDLAGNRVVPHHADQPAVTWSRDALVPALGHDGQQTRGEGAPSPSDSGSDDNLTSAGQMPRSESQGRRGRITALGLT